MSTADSRSEVWTFDDFEVGADLGTVEIPLDEQRLELWKRIYGALPADGTAPSGLLVAAMMEGYIKAIQPRPPGNVHAGQKLRFTGHQVAPGARLSLAFSCLGKEIKRQRRWLTFGVRALDGGRLAMTGEISSVWAA